MSPLVTSNPKFVDITVFTSLTLEQLAFAVHFLRGGCPSSTQLHSSQAHGWCCQAGTVSHLHRHVNHQWYPCGPCPVGTECTAFYFKRHFENVVKGSSLRAVLKKMRSYCQEVKQRKGTEWETGRVPESTVTTQTLSGAAGLLVWHCFPTLPHFLAPGLPAVFSPSVTGSDYSGRRQYGV